MNTSSNVMTDLVIRRLGLQDYIQCFDAMKAFTETRTKQTVDELWLLEHPPVFTQGRAGKQEHLNDLGDVPLIHADRGGQVTYHGPGQLTAYTLIDLTRKELGVRALVTGLENVVVATLAAWDIQSAPRADAPGVYVGGAKIASLGLRIKHGRSYHGLTINLDMEKEHWLRINPCGLGVPITQVIDHVNESPTLDELGTQFATNLCTQLHYNAPTCTEELPKGFF